MKAPQGAFAAKDMQRTNPEPLRPGLCLAKTRKVGAETLPGRTLASHSRLVQKMALKLVERIASSWPGVYGVLPENFDLAPLSHDIGKMSPLSQIRLWEKIGCLPRDLEHVVRLDDASFGGHSAVGFSALKQAGYPALAEIAGLHHGKSVRKLEDGAICYGGPGWSKARQDFIKHLFGNRKFQEKLALEARDLLLGLVIASDWLASAEMFDNPFPGGTPPIEAALDEAGLVWPGIRKNLSFSQVFGFAPNAMQEKFARAVAKPGFYILEAPMGEGKTEAALYAAYGLLEKKLASGVYFGLPSQISSNAMHGRLQNFADGIYEQRVLAGLIHGQAKFAHWAERRPRWLDSPLRAMLAPCSAGSLDQALLAAMPGKWSPLRLFGLCGKVVILDEIHSFDSYTGGLIDRLCENLLKIGCSVIILSATLSRTRRGEFLKAGAKTVPASSSMRKRISVSWPENDEGALARAVEAAKAGCNVVWIENTVAQARKIYDLVSASGIEAGLLHSRFTARDRAEKEKRWLEILGGAARGCVLVGTQVLEESLDIDADLLVSRFAPIDSILQRAGRLWRRIRARPVLYPELVLLAPAPGFAINDPETAFGPSVKVYHPWILAKSLAAFSGRNELRLPKDIDALMDAAYADCAEKTAAMSRARLEYENLVKKEKTLCAAALSRSWGPLANNIKTRLFEIPMVKIHVLESLDLETGFCQPFGGPAIDLRADGAGDWLAPASLTVPLKRAPEPAGPEVFSLFRPHLRGESEIRLVLDGSYSSETGYVHE